MLLAIDIGNTQTVFGLETGGKWTTWRLQTDHHATEDEMAAKLRALFDLSELEFRADAAICASVVPPLNNSVARLCSKWLGLDCLFLKHDSRLGLDVTYQPPTAVGADRLANALGALERFKPPIIVVDFGTATTFDAIDAGGTYIGGAILPGVMVSTEALVGHTAKLPQIEFKTPDRVIGRTTIESLQSGIVLGYAGAIDSLARRMTAELGGAKVISTGGLGSMFLGICETIESHEPNLTLEGLSLAWARLSSSQG
jgi:type III pantothenate kinase